MTINIYFTSFFFRVNFKKIIPKSGLFKSSEVFKHLNAEAIKTKAEKDSEIKRWTTFLQKPDRPVPKSKLDLENERKAEMRYRITICKQPKPRCAPNRTPTPPRTPEPVVEPIIELIPGPEPQYVEYLSEPPPQIIEPTAENLALDAEPVQEEKLDENTEQTITENVAEEKEEENKKTAEELLIEKQLSDVQQQLLALSTLPLTIQATLDAVTKQLADLMPALKHQQINNKDVLSTITDSDSKTLVEGRQ